MSADFTRITPHSSRGSEPMLPYRKHKEHCTPVSVVAPGVTKGLREVANGQGASGRNLIVAGREAYLEAHPRFPGKLPELCDAIATNSWWGRRAAAWIGRWRKEQR